MSLFDVPSPALLCFLNFPEMVFLREASKDARSHFEAKEVMWIMRGRLLKMVRAPGAELIMRGGFALSGFLALKFLHGSEHRVVDVYYSMNYPPPVLKGIEGKNKHKMIARLTRATKMHFIDRTTRTKLPTLHEELSFDVHKPFCITVGFSNVDERIMLSIELSTRSSLNSLVG